VKCATLFGGDILREGDLGYRFKRIHECFKANGNKRAKKFELTKTQMDILHYLFKNSDRQVTQRELELHFSIKHSTVIGILGRMEKNGFIKISVCEDDRRQRCVKLLEKAYDVRAECKINHEYIENKFRENFSHDELESFIKLLDKTYDILKEDAEND